jgi:hypothetical protein
MRSNNDMCDVRLVLKEEILLAHSCVLAATSPFFKSIFSGADNLEINLEDFPNRIILNILDFIYTGTSLFPKEDLELLHNVASTLNIPGLVDITKEMMLQSVPEEAIDDKSDVKNIIVMKSETDVADVASDSGVRQNVIGVSKVEDDIVTTRGQEFVHVIEHKTEDEIDSVMNEDFIAKFDSHVQEHMVSVSDEEFQDENDPVSVVPERFVAQLQCQAETSRSEGMATVINPDTQLENQQHVSVLTSNMKNTGTTESLDQSNITLSTEGEAMYYDAIQCNQNTNTITLFVRAEDNGVFAKADNETSETADHKMEVLYTEDGNSLFTSTPCQVGIICNKKHVFIKDWAVFIYIMINIYTHYNFFM